MDGFLFALTSADRVLEEGLLDLESLESSFLQISIETVTLTHVSEVSPWVSLGTVHMSIYLGGVSAGSNLCAGLCRS